jgi:2-oxoglutarate ferredoxin oxidoreductase subunit alpha
VDAGVNFFAGYPITPASSIYAAMLKNLQAEGKVALGVSDEISALSMCVGASMRGAKSMTASAAPGISLMVETISYALVTETPVLITVAQRLGPSTGAATQNAEGDLAFLSNMIAGGYPIPIIAINSAKSAYDLTIKAINTSELLRCPVILLSEKDLIMSSYSFETDDLVAKQIINRTLYGTDPSNPNRNGVFKTYNFAELDGVPEFVTAGSQAEEPRVVITGSMHDKAGNLSKNSPEALEMLQHHRSKIVDNLDKYLFYELNDAPDAEIAIISFLATDLAVREALRSMPSKNEPDGSILRFKPRVQNIKHLTLQTLFPIPEALIRETLKGCKHLIIPEENMTGQYANAIAHITAGMDIKVHRINALGRMIKPEEIKEVINACL